MDRIEGVTGWRRTRRGILHIQRVANSDNAGLALHRFQPLAGIETEQLDKRNPALDIFANSGI